MRSPESPRFRQRIQTLPTCCIPPFFISNLYYMPVTRRPIPPLPDVPRPAAIAKDLHRSYPTGRLEYSRAFVGSPIELSISTTDWFTADTQARLVTNINATQPSEWLEVPFVRRDDRTFTCGIVPDRPGLFSFWARFSTDGGETWRHDPVPDAWVLVDPPQVDQMRLYTLIPSVSGSIRDWALELARIKGMGFNTVHLLPLTTLDTSRSPYSAHDLFSVEPNYLAGDSALDGLSQLEAFVDTARRLEMRLCFDLVLNHVGVDSRIARTAPEWIMPDETSPDGMSRAHFWCEHGKMPWNDLVLIDYEHPSQRIRADIWDYMTEYALFWANYADQTHGFVRFDNLHGSDKAFVDHVSEALRSVFPNLAIIAEYFTDAATVLTTVPKWNLNLLLATPWDSRFVPQLREYLRYLHSMSEHVRYFMPITSHDSGSPAQEFGSVESTVPRYIAAALLGTGATGITQGVEWGLKEKIQFIGTQPRLCPTGEPRYAEFLRRVNDILCSESVFHYGENCHFLDGGHEAIIAVFRKDTRPGQTGCLVACNFDISKEQSLELDLSAFLEQSAIPRPVDLLTRQTFKLDGPQATLTLPPCGAVVLKF